MMQGEPVARGSVAARGNFKGATPKTPGTSGLWRLATRGTWHCHAPRFFARKLLISGPWHVAVSHPLRGQWLTATPPRGWRGDHHATAPANRTELTT